MRLRYLHLPRCGPLTDTSVVFGRDEVISKALKLERKGSLNFVVGVNGSGKSSLLRAIYRIFSAVNRREWPALPVTIAWDRTIGNEPVTTIIHYTNHQSVRSFFATFKQVPTSARRNDWEEVITSLGNEEPHVLVDGLDVEYGLDAIKNPLLFSRIPKRLIAYTSGAVDPWVQLEHPVISFDDEVEGQYKIENERPHCWTMDREWEEEQSDRVTNILFRYTEKMGDKARVLPGDWLVDMLPETAISEFMQEFGPMNETRKKSWTNNQVRTDLLDDTCFRLNPAHLRFTGITLSLWQAAKELSGHSTEKQQNALRNKFLQQDRSEDKPQNARRVLNELDWFWPTHLSLTYLDDERAYSQQHQELLCLVALADEVIAQPRGRHRAIVSLGPTDRINLTEKLEKAFPDGIPGSSVETIAKRVDECKTGAEAIVRIFSQDDNLDSTPMDVFTRLRDWERTGLLEEITLTIKRLNCTETADGEPDDIIVTYDQLSDGEQMLLGRMGLLFLLRGQDGSLLLLDEPETHFNDVWKREIVNMVDMALLNTTETNVIVSTHTSIALTDAFAAEVTVFDKNRDTGITTVRGVKGGLFGTDPGEVNMNLFRADSSIGSRSVELLDRLLKADWKGKEDELEEILNVLGSSFHRAELRAILKRLKAGDDGVA